MALRRGECKGENGQMDKGAKAEGWNPPVAE